VMDRCRRETPADIIVSDKHTVACHLFD